MALRVVEVTSIIEKEIFRHSYTEKMCCCSCDLLYTEDDTVSQKFIKTSCFISKKTTVKLNKYLLHINKVCMQIS